MDELWSFVGNKRRNQWVWLVIDRDTREVVGLVLGDRSEQTARKFSNITTAILFMKVSIQDF